MKILTFQAARFWWKSFSKTLEEVEEIQAEQEVLETVVAFLHAESRDEEPELQAKLLRRADKHLKWIANKRSLERVVLHSFTHLGAENAAPGFAAGFLDQLAERLTGKGFEVFQTPFGYFCEWELKVYGESLAKVWKEL